jgi:hypothetical protein
MIALGSMSRSSAATNSCRLASSQGQVARSLAELRSGNPERLVGSDQDGNAPGAVPTQELPVPTFCDGTQLR